MSERVIARNRGDAVKFRHYPEIGVTNLVIGTPSTGQACSVRLTPTVAKRIAKALNEWVARRTV
jgi:hypothetical protein